MKNNDINIRDPFVLYENGKYYMYGTRANNFGKKTKGFDVYVSENLENWSEPTECFNSELNNMNYQVNWAPEVHKYKNAYYMFATFTRESNGLRGTFILKSDSPLGPFIPHSNGVVTPEDWECLDGTLYLNREGKPYIVFCHEHTQIIDGTICYAPLSDDLREKNGEAVTLFKASEPYWADKSKDENEHRITDGPFMYRTKTDELLMLWSTFIKGKYAECLVKFDGGEIGTDFTHLEPLIDDDGGHGMIFTDEEKLYLTFHSPNKQGFEKPCFVEIEDKGYNVSIKQSEHSGKKMKAKRTVKDKLNTFLFGKDLRVTEGEPYTEVSDGDYSSYYPVEKYIDFNQPMPENCFDIRNYGADTNKSDTENTRAVQKALDECNKNGGGTVLVEGGCYEVTTLFLHSNITLFIEKNSSLSANTSGKGYAHNALIYAKKCENITITGGGKIIGNGTLFGRKPVSENCFEPDGVIDVIKMRQDYRAQLRFAHPTKYGSILLTEKCRNVNINNIIFEDSPWWTYKMLMCDGVQITNTVIWNNRNVANSDGFDIAGSSNVEIDHCFVSTADDGIVLKNAVWCGCEKEMHGITVKNCEVISRTNCFKIGTETTYDIYDVTVENCSFFMTDLYPGAVSGVSVEACDGSRVHDIIIKNITMNRCTCPLFIRLGNRNRAAEVTSATANKTEIIKENAKDKPVSKRTFDGKSELYDVIVENITATDVELPVIVAGYRQKFRTKYCRDITLRNFNITYRDATEVYDKRLFIPEYAKEYPECWRFRNLPAYGIWARHCRNLKIENFNCKGIKNSWRKEKIFIDCK